MATRHDGIVQMADWVYHESVDSNYEAAEVPIIG